jgi:hypothetical protein
MKDSYIAISRALSVLEEANGGGRNSPGGCAVFDGIFGSLLACLVRYVLSGVPQDGKKDTSSSWNVGFLLLFLNPLLYSLYLCFCSWFFFFILHGRLGKRDFHQRST